MAWSSPRPLPLSPQPSPSTLPNRKFKDNERKYQATIDGLSAATNEIREKATLVVSEKLLQDEVQSVKRKMEELKAKTSEALTTRVRELEDVC